MISSLSELYFRFRRFILLVQTKKVIPLNYGSSTNSWKPWRWERFDLILTMRNIYINSNLNSLTKFTSSSRSTEFKDILLWNICPMMLKTIPVNTRIIIIYAMKRVLPFHKKSMETETTLWSELSAGGKAIVKQILATEKRKKSKRARLSETMSEVRVG